MKINIDQNLNVKVILGGANSVSDTVAVESVISTEKASSSNDVSTTTSDVNSNMDVGMGGDMYGGIIGEPAKDPLLSSWPFVIGISSVTLIVSIVLGILLAKRKIKKGFELYED